MRIGILACIATVLSGCSNPPPSPRCSSTDCARGLRRNSKRRHRSEIGWGGCQFAEDDAAIVIPLCATNSEPNEWAGNMPGIGHF